MDILFDRNSEAWLNIRRAINERIDKLRDDLEREGVPPEGLRGEIAGLRWLLKTVEPDAPIKEPTSTDYMQSSAPDPS